jgi:hypothetical protein
VRTSVKTAWSTFNTSMKTAGSTWKTAQKGAWSTFRTALKACKAPTETTDSSNSTSETSGQ